MDKKSRLFGFRQTVRDFCPRTYTACIRSSGFVSKGTALLASSQRVHNFSSWGQRVRHFLVQGLSSPRPKGKEASKAPLFRTRARSSFSAMPKVSHAARRAHGARRAPWGWGGREGGCAEGAPLKYISSLNQYISLTPICAPPAGAHRTHKLNRNTNEEQ